MWGVQSDEREAKPKIKLLCTAFTAVSVYFRPAKFLIADAQSRTVTSLHFFIFARDAHPPILRPLSLASLSIRHSDAGSKRVRVRLNLNQCSNCELANQAPDAGYSQGPSAHRSRGFHVVV